MAVLSASSNPIFLFLDGLDEIAQEEQHKTLEFLDKLCSHVPQLRVCVSSRPEPIFQKRLGNLPALRLQDLTREDIRQFASGVLTGTFDVEDLDF